jgi:alcohol dehydrogenase class IV
MTDVFCLEGIRLAAKALPRAFACGADAIARRDMALAALYGGFALANAGLGVVHGFAAPLGGMFPAPHGAVCAALLPHGLEANIRALRKRAADSDSLRRYDEVARILTGTARAEDVVGWTGRLCRDLRIPALSAYGVNAGDVPLLVEKAARASSMKANPIALTEEELSRVVAGAI